MIHILIIHGVNRDLKKKMEEDADEIDEIKKKKAEIRAKKKAAKGKSVPVVGLKGVYV